MLYSPSKCPSLYLAISRKRDVSSGLRMSCFRWLEISDITQAVRETAFQLKGVCPYCQSFQDLHLDLSFLSNTRNLSSINNIFVCQRKTRASGPQPTVWNDSKGYLIVPAGDQMRYVRSSFRRMLPWEGIWCKVDPINVTFSCSWRFFHLFNKQEMPVLNMLFS